MRLTRAASRPSLFVGPGRPKEVGQPGASGAGSFLHCAVELFEAPQRPPDLAFAYPAALLLERRCAKFRISKRSVKSP